MTTETATVDPSTFAPWPTADNVTSDVLARHYAVEAFISHCRICRHPAMRMTPEVAGGEPVGAYRAALERYNLESELAFHQYALAYMLREANGSLSMSGDQLALRLRADYDDAEKVSDTLTDWLEEYGIEPETIIRSVLADLEGGR